MARRAVSSFSRNHVHGETGKEPPTSIPAAIADRLRDEILRGDLLPSTRIVETRLCKEIGVGQPTLREALLLLERQGLVRRVPNLGTFVTELDIEDIRNLQRVRIELEGLAAELASRRASTNEIEQLDDLIEKIRIAALNGNRWDFFQSDLSFHRFLWKLSGNDHLEELLERTTVPLLAFSLVRDTRLVEELLHSVDTHRAIVCALKEGPDNARKAVSGLRKLMDTYISRSLDGS